MKGNFNSPGVAKPQVVEIEWQVENSHDDCLTTDWKLPDALRLPYNRSSRKIIPLFIPFKVSPILIWEMEVLALQLHGAATVNPNPNNPVGLVPQLHGAVTVNPNLNNLVELGPQLHGVATLNPHPNPVIHTAVIHKCRHLVGLVLRLHGGQFGCGILKLVGPKKQDFCPRINILEGFLKKICWWISVCQKVPKLYFQSIFDVKNQANFFKKNFRSIWETISE